MAGTLLRVSSAQMRRLFNEGRYWERGQKGEFTTVVVRESHPSPPRAGQPLCTRSQMVSYRDRSGREVARVHPYLRPDGSLGASGQPDPKRLFQEGILYWLSRETP